MNTFCYKWLWDFATQHLDIKKIECLCNVINDKLAFDATNKMKLVKLKNGGWGQQWDRKISCWSYKNTAYDAQKS